VTRSSIIRAVFLACIVAYPLIVFFGLQHLPPGVFAIALMILLGMRYGVLLPSERPVYLPVLFIYLAYAVTAALSQSATMLLYYPAIVNLTMSGVFLFSLRQGEPLLLRIVRARGIVIGGHGPVYLYRLTGIWAAFFIVNALVSIWTTTQSIEVWTLYNGFLSYFLVGALIGLEVIFRDYFKQRMGVEKP
jgi:uncharacterized membrane protein